MTLHELTGPNGGYSAAVAAIRARGGHLGHVSIVGAIRRAKQRRARRLSPPDPLAMPAWRA